MSITKYEARQLMNRGYEMGAKVLSGLLQCTDDGVWVIDGKPLQDWLELAQGRPVVVIASEISAERGTKHICAVCGTEYEGHECPRCQRARRRLRG